MILSLVGYGVLLLVGYRVEQALTRRWDKDWDSRNIRDSELTALEMRRCTVAERQMALEERKFEKAATLAVSEPMPQELVDRIMAWEDDWAQDQERAQITQLYAEVRDWDKVMQRLPALNQ